MKRFTLLLFILIPVLSLAQEQQNNFGIKFSGYVKNDFFYDSRKTVGIREGHFYLYPENIRYDADSNDINAKTTFNILSIQTRLRGDIFGPDAFGAKTSGVIEGEFYGTTDASINCFRLRHAFAKLSWATTDLVIGQTWHGMFFEECFPEIMAVNTGCPFQPFSRNPQIKVVQKLQNFKFILSVMSQREFAEWGGSDALRNAALPDMNLRISYQHFNEDQTRELFIGGSADYKVIVPRLVTDSNFTTNSSLNAYAFSLVFKYRCPKVTFKLSGVYGQDLYSHTMLGGYAYKYTTDSMTIARGDFSYTPLNTFSGWLDFTTNGPKFRFGILGGYTKNFGSFQNILDWTNEKSYFARGWNISYVYRISPRFIFISGKVKMGLEGDYTVAGYGNSINSLGEVKDVKPVSNVRLMYSFFYYF
ncbi:MAG TPA: hypothetical protein PKI01_01805 [Bacteroidales bacterium]|nr:hypothetical protein [Bacteroidales bacterium]